MSLSLYVCVCVCVCVQVTFESDPRQQFLSLLGYNQEELEQKVRRGASLVPGLSGSLTAPVQLC